MIPVENLVHMLAYGWRELAHLRTAALPTVPLHNAGEVLAWLFLLETKRLLRQGLDQDYVERDADLAQPRGRVDVDASLARMLKPKARLACVVDEREVDVPVNQCLLAVLRAMQRDHRGNAHLVERCQTLIGHVHGVTALPLTRRMLHSARGKRQHKRYATALLLADLWHRRCLPERAEERAQVPWPQAESEAMRMIFQRFVDGFCDVHRARGLTLAGHTAWSEKVDPHDRIPGLYTDTTLRHAERTLVIECKYTPHSLTHYRGVQRYDPHHWRQLLVYAEQTRRNTQKPVSGLLLYALGDGSVELDDAAAVWGVEIRVATVNLGQPWQGVEAQLGKRIGAFWLNAVSDGHAPVNGGAKSASVEPAF